MKRDDLARLLLSIALIAVAGCVDAIGFLETGHLFVSFMSGNSTQFTVGLAHLDWSKATLPGLFVGIFFIATFVGRLAEIYARGWSRPLILACEAVLLTAAGLVLSPTTAALTQAL